MSAPDPKPEPRVRDHQLLLDLHLRWRSCALNGYLENCQHESGVSLHHISKHPKDDLEGNLVMVCGSGTTGCHGRLEAHDADTKRALSVYIYQQRDDVFEYLNWRFPAEGADSWLIRTLGG